MAYEVFTNSEIKVFSFYYLEKRLEITNSRREQIGGGCCVQVILSKRDINNSKESERN